MKNFDRNSLISSIRELHEAINSIQNDPVIHEAFELTLEICVSVYKKQGKILIAGNGGSAGDAQHFAGELVSRFYFDRDPLSAIALTTDTSVLTAIGNDYGYEDVFSRQIKAHGKQGDLFIALSTSGNSPNILKAIETAKERGLLVIGLTGRSGGKMKSLCDVCICAPSASTPRIQECHLILEHALCACIEETIFLKSLTS